MEDSKSPLQRKTTLKWDSNGELSAIDMARIINKLSNPELKECELSCNIKDYPNNTLNLGNWW
tara:strand:- start:18633 stop:18821 length:189 start_codon:yes stop_codon:yes gene_type:complete